MMLLITKGWDEYQLLDSGEGRRLERYGAYVLDRPDPQCIWKTSQGSALWAKADAVFQRKDDREVWVTKSSIPSQWRISYKEISFYARLTPFKHTGIFPEQSLQWEFLKSQITNLKSQNPKKRNKNSQSFRVHRYRKLSVCKIRSSGNTC